MYVEFLKDISGYTDNVTLVKFHKGDCCEISDSLAKDFLSHGAIKQIIIEDKPQDIEKPVEIEDKKLDIVLEDKVVEPKRAKKPKKKASK